MSNTTTLEKLLEQEIAAYSQLLQIEREKEQAIIRNDADALLEILSREEPAVAHANELERRILEARDALARQVGISGKPASACLPDRPESTHADGHLTLREIIAALEPPRSERLESLRVKLFGFAEEIRRINQTNYLLLKQSIELLDEVISAILGEAAPVNTYEPDGRVQPGADRSGALSVRA